MKKILLVLMAMFALGFQNVNAQDGIKIVTNHPDFKIKVSRCVANGKSVFLDLILTNEGVNDLENINLYGIAGHCRSVCYDDQGNIYDDNIFLKLANRKDYQMYCTGDFNIPVGVPIRISIRIDNFSTTAESIARISLPFACETWGLNVGKPTKIANIPISRN